MKKRTAIFILILIILLLLLMAWNVKLNIMLTATTNNLNQTTQKLQQVEGAYNSLQQKVTQLDMEKAELIAQIEAVQAQREQDRKVLSSTIREKNQEIEAVKDEVGISTEAKVIGVVTGLAATAWMYIKTIPKVVATP